MGWFWADGAVPTTRTMPHHHFDSNSARSPPPECPMHQKTATAITPAPKVPESACPYTPPDATPRTIEPTSPPTSTRSKYNPLNYMFSEISQKPSPNQGIILDTEREPSTIPRGTDPDSKTSPGNWEYPSPQQMYNALLRKGYHDTDPSAVTSMVSVHNFLNEGAWAEIAVHEGLFSSGLQEGWRRCRNGEENIDVEKIKAEADPKLMRFQGRPKDMTPKAAMWQVLGWIYPAKFETAPPFDRHDWFVERVSSSGSPATPPTVSQIRYVIDYYAAPDDEDGNPVFALDVRPAVDSPRLVAERVIRWTGDVWWRAKGGEVAWTKPWIDEKQLAEIKEKKGWF